MRKWGIGKSDQNNVVKKAQILYRTLKFGILIINVKGLNSEFLVLIVKVGTF